jgi:hypothetical protein
VDGDYRRDQAEAYPWNDSDDPGLPAGVPDDRADVRALAGPLADEIRQSLGIGTLHQDGGLADRPDVRGLAEGLGLR